MVKLIAIDMDETLLKSDKTYDQHRFKKILQLLSEHHVCIASGNSYHKLVEYFDEEMINQLYFASDNGNYLVKNGNLLRVIGMTKSELLSIVDFIDKQGDCYVNVSIGDCTYLREKSGVGYERVVKYNNTIQWIEQFDLLPDDAIVTKIAIYRPRNLEENKALAQEIQSILPTISVVTSGDQWIDVYHVAGGKGSAIDYLQEKYLITPNESMAFGDSLNDYTMMQQVEYSIAMANADKELISICKYQIGSNQEESVLEVLEQLIQFADVNQFMKEYQIV